MKDCPLCGGREYIGDFTDDDLDRLLYSDPAARQDDLSTKLLHIITQIRELAEVHANDRDDDSPAHFIADDILDIMKEHGI